MMTVASSLPALLAAQGVSTCVVCTSPGLTSVLEVLPDSTSPSLLRQPDPLSAWEKSLKMALEGSLTALLVCDFSLSQLSGHLSAAAWTDIPGGLLILTVESVRPPRTPNPRALAAFADLPALVAGEAAKLPHVLATAASWTRAHRLPVILPLGLEVLESLVTDPLPLARPPLDPASLLASPDLDDRAARHRGAMLALANAGSIDVRLNAVHALSPSVGVIVDAALAPRVREQAPQVSMLALAQVHPIPEKLVRYFGTLVKELQVLDAEGSGLRDRLRDLGLCVASAGSLPEHRPVRDEELASLTANLRSQAGMPIVAVSDSPSPSTLDTPVRTFDAMLSLVSTLPPRRVAIAGAHNAAALHAGIECVQKGLGTPVFIGDPEAIAALARKDFPDFDPQAYDIIPAFADAEIAATAVSICREGKADILLKGAVNTPTLMRAALSGSTGLRTGSLLSDSFVFEYPDEDGIRLMIITDGGVTPNPTFHQKIEIMMNSVLVAQALGIAKPRVGLLAASETVNPAVPVSMDSAAIMEMNRAGLLPGCVVEGPIALDVAVSRKAAAIKGTDSQVAGQADILVAPTIDTANALAKSTTYFAGYRLSHVIVGGKVPILIASRSDTADAKLLSIALGSLMARYQEARR